MPRGSSGGTDRQNAPASSANVDTPDIPEAVVAKTVKLPRSLDDQLRQYCATARRTGQDVMHDAIRQYLHRTSRQGSR